MINQNLSVQLTNPDTLHQILFSLHLSPFISNDDFCRLLMKVLMKWRISSPEFDNLFGKCYKFLPKVKLHEKETK